MEIKISYITVKFYNKNTSKHIEHLEFMKVRFTSHLYLFYKYLLIYTIFN
jgi:hypothetical protein